MALAPGARIGIYEITAPIGEGGMGAVYRARDTRLGRDVALKVLPDSFSNDADRVARFTREAQVLASLDHPNIATIYGLEQAGTNQIIVIEIVEGATPEARLEHGPLAIGGPISGRSGACSTSASLGAAPSRDRRSPTRWPRS